MQRIVIASVLKRCDACHSQKSMRSIFSAVVFMNLLDVVCTITPLCLQALASAVLLRTRIPESQLNEPVPLDQQSSRSRDPMMVPRAESRSILPAGTAANASHGRRPGNAVSNQQGDHTVGGSVGNSGPRYMPSSPRHSFDGRGLEEGQHPDQPGGSTGPSGAASWSVNLHAPTKKTIGWGPLGDSTHSAVGMGASNSSFTHKKPDASSSLAGSHSTSRAASNSSISRHASKPASSSGNVSSHRVGRHSSRTPQEKLSVVPERSSGDRFKPSGLRTDVSTGGVPRPGRQQLQESMDTFDENAEMDITVDSQTAEGDDTIQCVQQPVPLASPVPPAAATSMRSKEYLPVLPSMQPDIVHDGPPDTSMPQAGIQAQSVHRNSPLGMHPSQSRAANVGTVGDGFFGNRLPWIRTNETTFSVTLAQSENLDERPPPGEPVLAMHEAWSLASKSKK